MFAFFMQALTALRSIDEVCFTEPDNEPSKRLHASLGFTDTGEVRPFGRFIFGDDETTWVKFI